MSSVKNVARRMNAASGRFHATYDSRTAVKIAPNDRIAPSTCRKSGQNGRLNAAIIEPGFQIMRTRMARVATPAP